MVGTAESASGVPESKRPKDPTKLLLQKDVKSLWQARNFKANRFSVLNLDLVIGEIGLEHTNSKKYFVKAEEAIEKDGWRKLYKFEYSCSHTQIYPQNRSEARRFGHAATAIVALEFAAAELEPGYDVYEKLRILPATYFVDLFDRDQLAKARSSNKTFDQECLATIGQEFDKQLLNQHCWGMTVTKPVAEGLLTFLKATLPNVNIGPVRCVGDPDQRSNSLGCKNRASDLTVPTTIAVVPPL